MYTPTTHPPPQVWCVSARGPVLLTAATDASLRVWDLRASERPVLGLDRAHEDAIAGLQFDGTKASSTPQDETSD